MSAYYNENDPAAAAWLRNLISADLIAAGVVDERSIADVQPNDLEGFTQHHFFAGIGGWSYALRLADWPDERPVWTGSCPCQPWSVAGRGKGADDDRHLWPHFARLIGAHRPSVIFGEQVASAAGRIWLSRVRVDLEALGYGVGCADLCAAGVGAPHIRQRLWWVADTGRYSVRGSGHGSSTATPGGVQGTDGEWQRVRADVGADGSAERGRLADVDGRFARHGELQSGGQYGQQPQDSGATGGMGDSDSATPARLGRISVSLEPEQEARRSGNANPWAGAVFIGCADGKARRIEPGLEPLANGVSGRVAALRGYGNAIVPQVAEAFIRAYNET